MLPESETELSTDTVKALTDPEIGIFYKEVKPSTIPPTYVLKTEKELDELIENLPKAVALDEKLTSTTGARAAFEKFYGIKVEDQLFTKDTYRTRIMDIVGSKDNDQTVPIEWTYTTPEDFIEHLLVAADLLDKLRADTTILGFFNYFYNAQIASDPAVVPDERGLKALFDIAHEIVAQEVMTFDIDRPSSPPIPDPVEEYTITVDTVFARLRNLNALREAGAFEIIKDVFDLQVDPWADPIEFPTSPILVQVLFSYAEMLIEPYNITTIDIDTLDETKEPAGAPITVSDILKNLNQAKSIIDDDAFNGLITDLYGIPAVYRGDKDNSPRYRAIVSIFSDMIVKQKFYNYDIDTGELKPEDVDPDDPPITLASLTTSLEKVKELAGNAELNSAIAELYEIETSYLNPAKPEDARKYRSILSGFANMIATQSYKSVNIDTGVEETIEVQEGEPAITSQTIIDSLKEAKKLDDSEEFKTAVADLYGIKTVYRGDADSKIYRSLVASFANMIATQSYKSVNIDTGVE
ncbi:MAG TPA: hypothetical protein PLV52_03115, partial [Candidatus Omnitrophota bacterium]|nr:hypothetical protein [Candidatus Omnitrophota bacterium]